MHRHCPDQPARMLEQAPPPVTTYANLQLFRTMVVTAPLGETVALLLFVEFSPSGRLLWLLTSL